jgi:late competence protein required for DNA uptake (superfamily II DNA/RNA helicase)
MVKENPMIRVKRSESSKKCKMVDCQNQIIVKKGIVYCMSCYFIKKNSTLDINLFRSEE